MSDTADRLAEDGILVEPPIKPTMLEAKAFFASCAKALRPDLLTVKQAADALNVSPRTIYDLVETGRLKCQRIGKGRGTIRIKLTDLNNVTTPTTTYKHLRF